MGKQNFKGVPDSNWVVGPCQTEEIAKQVLAVAHAYGWEWGSGFTFLKKTAFFVGISYNIREGRSSRTGYYKSEGFTIISPETFLANNPMPEEKTRKPGVKYTLEDWKKKSEANRKLVEYWKDKFQVWDSGLNQLKLDLDTTNKNYTILQPENKVLKESNAELRGANETLTVQHNTLLGSYDFLKKERDTYIEELKTVKSHLELRTKGIQALEEDAKVNRIEIAALKSDFETKNAELEILEEDYNCLKDVQKCTKVIGWVGWIFFFIALFSLIFFKG